MNARELKDKYIKFFVERNHKEIPNASLIPENDSTTLFISAGMHPLVPYLMGQTHPLGTRLVNVQKCLRTGDIDEVGDSYHHTFFEMLGNWSLNDYFKKDIITWSFEFLTKELGFKVPMIHVTVLDQDKESPDIWECLGIPKTNIHSLGREDNWWERGGIDGPCGPDTEMFVDTTPNEPEVDFETRKTSGRYIEIWNDVFMDQYTDGKGMYKDLGSKNVDTGMGVERSLAVLSGYDDNYLTSIWQPIIKKIEELSGKKYTDDQKSFRIIADHVKAAVFIIADGVEPSNKEAGYVLRRLIRKALRVAKSLNINSLKDIAIAIINNKNNYAGTYEELDNPNILKVIETEENKFKLTLSNGLKEIEKEINKLKHTQDYPSKISNREIGSMAFYCYETFGFPLEMSLDEFKNNGIEYSIDEVSASFEEAKKLKKKISKTLKAGEFKSGLQNDSEIITKYHTATHLLHAALRKILGDHVGQSGSNITSERLRFDFTYNEKLTESQIKEIEALVNQKIKEDLTVSCENQKFEDAKLSGALAFFGNKYPEIVSVYTMGDFSKEICTGPHVVSTSELGIFKIQKEESVGGGKRRIYAILM